MAAEIKIEGDIFNISGELNFDTTPKLVRRTTKMLAKIDHAIFDLSKVTHVDNSALAFILVLMRRAHMLKINIAFRNLPKQLLDLAKLTSLTDFIPI